MAWVTVLRACLWPSEGSIEVDGPTNSEDVAVLALPETYAPSRVRKMGSASKGGRRGKRWDFNAMRRRYLWKMHN